MIVGLLSIFYIRNYPKNIQTVQTNRLETKSLIDQLSDYYNQDYTFVWRDEVLVEQNWDKIMSEFKHESLTTLLRHEFNQKDFIFKTQSETAKSLHFYPDEYRKILWDNNSKILTEKSGVIVVVND